MSTYVAKCLMARLHASSIIFSDVGDNNDDIDVNNACDVDI